MTRSFSCNVFPNKPINTHSIYDPNTHNTTRLSLLLKKINVLEKLF